MEKKLQVDLYEYDHKQKLGKFNTLDNRNIIYQSDLESINIIDSLSKDQITKLFINLN